MELETYKRLETIDSAITAMHQARGKDWSIETKNIIDLSMASARIKKIEIEVMLEIRDAIRALHPKQ